MPKLFIAGLAYDETPEHLTDWIDAHGFTVMGLKICQGSGRPYAFVNVPTKTQADDAIKKLDRKACGGSIVRVQEYRGGAGV